MCTWDVIVSCNFDIKVIKLGKSGNLEWEKTYGDEYWNEPLSVIQTVDGGYVIAGRTDSVGKCVIPDQNTCDFEAFVMKVDQSGKEIWSETYKGKGWYDVAWETAVSGHHHGGKRRCNSGRRFCFLLSALNGSHSCYEFVVAVKIK